MLSTLRQMFTGPDGRTHDIGRYSLAFSVVSFFGLAGYHLYAHAVFDPQSLGIGLGGVLGAHAALFKFKPEPPATDASGAPLCPPSS